MLKQSMVQGGQLTATASRLHALALATAAAGLGVFVAASLCFMQENATLTANVQPHEAKDVRRDMARLQRVGKKVRPTLPWRVVATRADDAAPIPEGAKKVHLIRHGQGRHNVAQAEWREAQRDGEPYTLSTDPDFEYGDAELTALGERQARDLRPRADALVPELMVTSPM